MLKCLFHDFIAIAQVVMFDMCLYYFSKEDSFNEQLRNCIA
jgi:hypothetical protein